MHTQGRHGVPLVFLLAVGTIHAHAGQTSAASVIYAVARNHPCTRGADCVTVCFCIFVLEPSMHTRGRHWGVDRLPFALGTIHAHAGQTVLWHRVMLSLRNHPCTRGADYVTLGYKRYV